MRLERDNRASELRPTWVEVDLGALGRNFGRVRDRVAPRRVWCVVKANAYGHGAVECARRLEREGADAFAVATVDEGIELRRTGIKGRILVMAGIKPLDVEKPRRAARAAVRHQLEVAVWGVPAARMLATAARQAGTAPAEVHLKVDTGMGRLGVMVGDDPEPAVRLTGELNALDDLRVTGLFSNLAAADAPEGSDGQRHTSDQIDRFGQLCAALEEADLLPPDRHLSNTAALLQHQGSWQADWCTGVRPGLCLYGVPMPAGDVTIELEPVMSWHSVVAAVREVPAGWPLGYGAARRASTDATIAVLPVGYHDGFPRALSDRGQVLVGGERAQVVGAISMDLTLVDITAIPAARDGTPVVLLGCAVSAGGSSIDAHELAGWANTIAHEVLSRVGTRVPRRFVEPAP